MRAGIAAQGAIALSNSFPSSADLTFSARPGAFLASGTADGRVRLTDGETATTPPSWTSRPRTPA
jgi:translocation and assembly module TamB